MLLLESVLFDDTVLRVVAVADTSVLVRVSVTTLDVDVGEADSVSELVVTGSVPVFVAVETEPVLLVIESVVAVTVDVGVDVGGRRMLVTALKPDDRPADRLDRMLDSGSAGVVVAETLVMVAELVGGSVVVTLLSVGLALV
jgi:hypothetical protein